MIKKITSLVLLFCCVVLSAKALPVDESTAFRVAKQFWQVNSSTHLKLVNVSHRASFQHLYLFESIDGNGFVVIAGNDIALPILGYSTQQGMGEVINPEATYWLRCLDDEIAWGIRQGVVAQPNVRIAWDRWMGADPSITPYETAVSPLVSTTWNQTSYYNDMCPSDASSSYNGHTLTGCVATAMAQIMKKWNYPTTGIGSHSYTHDTYGTLSANFANTTYQWSSMPNSLNSNSSATQKNAVATLMYHCGVSVEMDYGPSSSGATTNSTGHLSSVCAENSLMFYFGYNNTLHTCFREGHSVAEWSDMLKADLDAGRPILYSGRDVSGGHAFVCDGYNTTGHFHFNWGWGGYCNGYYVITALNPTSGGAGGTASSSYNLKQKAILGIQPRTTTPSNVTVTATGSNGTVSGTGTYAYGDTATLLVTAQSGYRFSRWSDGSYFNPRRIFTTNSITLTPVFVSLNDDTLQYERGYRASSFGSSSGSTTYFANKYLPADFSGYNTLSEILFYDIRSSSYTFSIYQGGSSSPATLIASQTVTLTGSEQWVSIPFAQPVALDSTQNLWIVGSSNANYAGPVDYYCGNINSTYYSSTGTSWTSITSWGYYYSWMMRAVLNNVVPPITSYTITATPASSAMGAVAGSGTYDVGDTVTLLALANEGYRFTGWDDGETINPRTIVVIGDSTFTANYSDLGVDTLRYDNGTYDISYGAGGAIHWAVKFNPVAWSSYAQLQAVKLFDSEAGNYSLTIHQGDTILPSTQIYSQSFSLSDVDDWVVIPLANPVDLPSHQPLWIVIHATASTYPASAAYYAGCDNSCYVSVDNSSWATLTSMDIYGSWMLRAVIGNPVTYTINASSADTTMGNVLGAGIYEEGDTVMLQATPFDGYHFVKWSNQNTSNPYVFTATQDMTLTAYFEADYVGIEEMTTPLCTIAPNPTTGWVSIQGIVVDKIELLDLQGRLLSIVADGNTLDISLLPAGTYYLRFYAQGESFVKRIVKQ